MNARIVASIRAKLAATEAAIADEAAGQATYEAKKDAVNAAHNKASLTWPDDDLFLAARHDEYNAAMDAIDDERDAAWSAHFVGLDD